MARAASSIGTLPRSVPMPGIAMTLKLLRSLAIRAARAARRTFSAPIIMPGSSMVGTWMTFLAGSWPAVVTIAAPTAIGAAAIAACWITSPPWRRSEPPIPPPMIPNEFAGLTTASTGIDHRSAFATCTCIREVGYHVRMHGFNRELGAGLLELGLDLFLGPLLGD